MAETTFPGRWLAQPLTWSVEDNSMAERYRHNAAECRYQAKQAEDGPWKEWLLVTAERYEAMVTQADESADG